jgi:MFS family permease
MTDAAEENDRVVAGHDGAENNDGSNSLDPSTQPSAPKPTTHPKEPITPVFQTGVIVGGNAAITIVAFLGLKYGEFADHSVPWLFWVSEVIVITVGVLTAFPERISDVWATLGLQPDDRQYSKPLQHWLLARGKIQPIIVYVLSVLVVVAVIALTVDTGGIVGSPFVPFLTAPALFGPFVAKRASAVGWLVAVVAITLAALGATQPKEMAYVCTTRAACKTAPMVTIVARRANAPEGSANWLYAGVAITLIVVAGSISRARLRRERTLEERLNALLTPGEVNGQSATIDGIADPGQPGPEPA